MALLFLITCLLSLTSQPVCACPADSALRAQQCFTDLASGVSGTKPERSSSSVTGRDESNAVGGQGSRSSGPRTDQSSYRGDVSGVLPLDYRKIREYCDDGGHMRRFLTCVETLLELCPELPQDGALRKLINPEHVRTSVPNLCNNVDKVEAGSDCMNSEVSRGSECKRRAYNMIKPGSHHTTSNSTSTFIVQCRFFRALVECQRTAVSARCGRDLGDLHADFLLSFVPGTCLDNTHLDVIGFQEGKGQLSDLLLGEGQGQGAGEGARQWGQGQVKDAKKSPEISKARSAGDASVSEEKEEVNKEDAAPTSTSSTIFTETDVTLDVSTTSGPPTPRLDPAEISPLSSGHPIFSAPSAFIFVACFSQAFISR